MRLVNHLVYLVSSIVSPLFIRLGEIELDKTVPSHHLSPRPTTRLVNRNAGIERPRHRKKKRTPPEPTAPPLSPPPAPMTIRKKTGRIRRAEGRSETRDRRIDTSHRSWPRAKRRDKKNERHRYRPTTRSHNETLTRQKARRPDETHTETE